MPDKFRVAFAGVHRSLQTTPGGHNWGSSFAPVKEMQVVAVYDAGRETREQFCATWKHVWGNIVPYGDYERMLDEVKPDILCRATEIGFAIHESNTLGGARVELPVKNRTRRIDFREWGNEEPK